MNLEGDAACGSNNSQRRRIAKVVDGTPTYFVYDLDWNAIAEYDGTMSLQAADVTVGVDDHVSRIEDSAAYLYCDDALETVAGLTNPSGDRFAVVQELPHWYYLLRRKPDATRGESMEDKA